MASVLGSHKNLAVFLARQMLEGDGVVEEDQEVRD
jgi:hypothetical protein